MPRSLSARLPRTRFPRLVLVELLGHGATFPSGESQVDAGVHELRPRALRALRSFQRGLGDCRRVAADLRGVSAPPPALPLRSKCHRSYVQPADGTPTVRIPANILEVDLGGPLSVGAHFDHRYSTRDRQSMIARAYYLVCLALGWLLRSARYTQAPFVQDNGVPMVRKRRAFYAPPLIWMGGLVVWALDTGTRVLAQREWEERERLIY